MERVDTWTGLWGASIPGLGLVASQIFLQHLHFGPFYVYSIVPCPTTPPIWQMFQALQPISEWYFWAWKYDMLANMQCLCSGGNNKVSMRDHDPWFIPYGYGMDDWVVFWCTMVVVEPKEKLFILSPKEK
ncbi:hypothetical protein FRACYDRAFT_245994 [Fragilariopsis cylindrus CCMP1102]|uniref:Uncharacterized protein n=1 Tax=Fragilariopsis cylindrus CCMP1102 TaxID=635003 RepID=A0A1E7EZY7_9STRA|nr:hypothetical protein FRACYDRAFT_245994 [Fragilariopsis cylindrus CCMP1102]|eukprot:OEU11426.1 hypothetical protein FRACYDRAFT_245994 [Fragilariopsis cylindrus CCMP1102]